METLKVFWMYKFVHLSSFTQQMLLECHFHWGCQYILYCSCSLGLHQQRAAYLHLSLHLHRNEWTGSTSRATPHREDCVLMWVQISSPASIRAAAAAQPCYLFIHHIFHRFHHLCATYPSSCTNAVSKTFDFRILSDKSCFWPLDKNPTASGWCWHAGRVFRRRPPLRQIRSKLWCVDTGRRGEGL